ncbi:ATP-grasp domain-containing protein [Actinoplanes awajinensis]|uniref:ATP-grasp domain-containing protein n=1 Tax=Actinoplanes awajinensis subsp. mycoplanecinus TaxID=135947 RepID=A0A101JN82_9ACTN|nr:hypothetical protein [Actinoplanes awajinensis]KUL29628.1 hypothetical protein ADL15_27335 [Actinoplanes awajinensis subsp. mycoplanecinus]
MRVLYVSDLGYEARGRRYGDEDIYLTGRLREGFDLAICHPLDARALMADFDVVVVRNSGPVLAYQAEYDAFRAAAIEAKVRVFTELSGKGDMAGKQYLLDLFAAGFPVIPTVDRLADLGLLPVTDSYVVKPKFGADSVGLTFVDRAGLDRLTVNGLLVQPRIDFRYEVSFYFVGHEFQYALYAPDPAQRWVLEPYEPTPADLVFAQRFIDWNDIRHGIQRVDACRTRDDTLLLVELEDLNPYLSLDRISPAARDRFVRSMAAGIERLAEVSP